MPRFITSITLKQIEVLEEACAKLTKDGWVIPSWLITLKMFAK